MMNMTTEDHVAVMQFYEEVLTEEGLTEEETWTWEDDLDLEPFNENCAEEDS